MPSIEVLACIFSAYRYPIQLPLDVVRVGRDTVEHAATLSVAPRDYSQGMEPWESSPDCHLRQMGADIVASNQPHRNCVGGGRDGTTKEFY